MLTADANQFINIGITAVPSADNYTFFNDGSFVTQPHSLYEIWTMGTKMPQYRCFSLGHREENPAEPKLSGTVRAVDIANMSVAEADIRSFFQLLP